MNYLKYATVGLALLAGWNAGPTMAQQDDADAQNHEIEEIVVIGGLGRPRSVGESPVPVDVFTSEDLQRSGYMETARLLQQIAPSFNFGTNIISDGSDNARPATLRGLGPDQVLVLVNGKRHIGQAWLNIGDSGGRGATGTDLNSIPILAIERIEVLRDGASSQYGSDAIAGVINIVLKSNASGTQVRGIAGQYYEGDGEQYNFSLNQGVSLGEGYLNFTVERRDQDFTNRADVSNRSFVFPGAEPTAGKTIVRIGQPEVDNWTFLANSALPMSGGFELYFTGKYMERESVSGGLYRHPHQADRSIPQVFPSGFLPLQNAEVEDYLAIGGLRWKGEGGWAMDLSANYAVNKFSWGAENSINASIAAEFLQNNPGATDAEIAANAGPTSVFSGANELDQFIVNFDITGEIDMGDDRPLQVVFGAEYRDEEYELIAGDLESFSCGLSAGPQTIPSVVDPATTANCGIQGFPGLSTQVAGSTTRDNFAFYADVGKRLTEKWLLEGGLRYEDFEAVGDKLTGKIATLLNVTDEFSLRGSFSTGFRAASLPQQGFTSVVTQGGAGGLSQSLIANLDDPFTQALGIESLDFETSDNYSAGFVWTPSQQFNLTVDVYQIDIDDRIVLSDDLNTGLLNSLGLNAAADILTSRAINQGAVFFNAVDTETQGIDVVATYSASMAGGSLVTTLSATYNETDVQNKRAPGTIDPDAFFGQEATALVEDVQPNERATLSFDYSRGRWNGLLRTNYFGETSSRFFTAQTIFGCPSDTACGPVGPFGLDPSSEVPVDDAFIIDLELGFDVTDNIHLAVGANNLFDKKPNELPDNAVIRWISDGGSFGGPPNDSFGNIKFPLRGVPYGFDGGYYYFRMFLTF